MLVSDSILKKESFKVTGMTCASCAVSLESYLKPVEGVEEVTVNYPNQSVVIQYESEIITLDQIRSKANEIGYEILISGGKKTDLTFEKIEENKLKTLEIKLLVSAVFSTPIFIMSMFLMGKIPFENWIMLGFSIPVLFFSGAEFYINAWRRLKHFTSNMDTLVALSTGVAFLFSFSNTVFPQFFESQGLIPHVYYESAVVIITFILLGRYLEERAKGKTSSAIKNLMGLQPKEVTVIRNGEEKVIPINEIAIGDLLVVKPGDKIPVDGKVKKGNSYIDESMISGEPIPVEKSKGDEVYTGTINQKGALRIIARKVGDETLLSQIIKMVEQAQASKPKIQKLVDKIAGVFVPVVIGIGLLTFMTWYFLGPDPSFTYAILSFITVIIIACPCALGLATPTALMVGVGKGAQKGILIKDAQALETALEIDTIILDKTGTITEGKPKVTDLIWYEEHETEMLPSVLLAIEKQSEHPVAAAIVSFLDDIGEKNIALDKFNSLTGLGAEAELNNKRFFVGNYRLMKEHQILIPDVINSKAKRLGAEAKTVVFFSDEYEVKAVIAVADTVKENSHDAILSLHEMGIEIFMLTGDYEQTAAILAKQTGINKFKAEVLPTEKGAFVKSLQDKGKIVAMVGDGINDAHALAQANVGIAMNNGTDIAMQSAGITLMNSDLQQVVKSIQLSRSTMKVIKQNLFWAFIYNLIALPIAAGVLYPISGFLLNPMIAGAAMALSSVSVVANSLRLRK